MAEATRALGFSGSVEVTPTLMPCEKPAGLMGPPAERDTGQRRVMTAAAQWEMCVIEPRSVLEPNTVAQRHHHLL